MTAEDRRRWDTRYTELASAGEVTPVALPAVFAPFAAVFPTAGTAVELACGRGQVSVWLALRGLTVTGFDVSAVAIEQATELAARSGVGHLCHFEVADLDGGLPSGPPVSVIVCHKFRDARLDGELLDRLEPGGVLAMSALHGVGRFRVADGDLERAFSGLDVISAGTTDGTVWLLAHR